MRVLISTPFYGGVGGLERHVHSVVRALAAEGIHVDIVARRVVPNGFYAVTNHVRLLSPSRIVPVGVFRRSLLRQGWKAFRPMFRYRQRWDYDLYIHYFHGYDLSTALQSRVRVIIPAGNVITERFLGFDAVLLEAPDNEQFVPPGIASVLIPPPVFRESEYSHPIAGLPPRFLLTVFNPYGEVKGGDVMLRVADHSADPIVWCSSKVTREFDLSVYRHPNIIPIETPSQSELRWLYENCRSYVSFSRSEGFGWAIADALQYGSAIVARRLGVLTIPNVDQSSVNTYESIDGLLATIAQDDFQHVERDLRSLEPDVFRHNIAALMKDLANVEPR